MFFYYKVKGKEEKRVRQRRSVEIREICGTK